MSELKVDGASTAPVASPLAGQIATEQVNASAYAGFEDTPVEGDSLEALRALAQELVTCEIELVSAQAKVAAANKALIDVQERRLPELMEKHSLKKFTFTDRRTNVDRIIELIEKWAVAMPPKQGKTMDPQWREKRAAIYEWLRSIGKGGLIKKDLTASLGLLSDEDTALVLAKFKELNPTIDASVDEKIEPASLTSLISKLKDEGKEVQEFLKVTPVHEARVKGS